MKEKIKIDSTKIWFTSDHHFGHKNIIEYAKRPFVNVEEMNTEMVRRWNERIGNGDIVYHIGDFALMPPEKLRQLRDKLNGKIYLIRGNHERSASSCANCFEWIKDYYELKVEDPDIHKVQLIVLFHYAMKVWNSSHYGSWHLFGHSHGSLQDDKTSLSFDVGVDCHNFFPLSYQDVKNIMIKNKWLSPFKKK